MDIFMDEEKWKRKKKFLVIALSVFFIIILLSFLAVKAWNEIRPLPNIDQCKDQGYEAGFKMNQEIICANKCESNTIQSCKIIKVEI